MKTNQGVFLFENTIFSYNTNINLALLEFRRKTLAATFTFD